MTSTAPTEGALLRAWRAGDQAAFGQLVARHEAALLRHARALLGREGAVEDVVQEAFLRLARTPPSLHGDPDGGAAGDDAEAGSGPVPGVRPDVRSGPPPAARSGALADPTDGLPGRGPARDGGHQYVLLSAWLHRVTRNLCMDALRTDTRRRAREAHAAPPEAIPPDPTVDAADTRAAVERSLERLPEDQREVLVLRLLAERSYREIAAITGRKVGTVGWLVSVGMKTLARELAPLLGMEAGGVPAGAIETAGVPANRGAAR